MLENKVAGDNYVVPNGDTEKDKWPEETDSIVCNITQVLNRIRPPVSSRIQDYGFI